MSNFRNYAYARLRLDERPVVLVGENGAGKTSLLEAVSLLGPGSGLRGRPYRELERRGGPGGWAIAGHVSRAGRMIEIGTGYGLAPSEEAAGRSVRIDGKGASPASLADQVKPVWLIPAMDGLFTGPASERRRFLDRLTLLIDPKMRSPRARFDRAMRQRNRLFQMGHGAPALFAGLEEEMATSGVAIAAARIDAVARLSELITSSKDALLRDHFPHAALALSGLLEEALAGHSASEVEDDYRARLEAGRERDRGAVRALEGPHLSDLVVTHGPSSRAAELCSSGEQKALLLGLVLAQAELIRRIDGTAPLILLDEVAAHLDDMRRNALFSEILRLKAQAWMTGTEAELFRSLTSQAQILTVNRGTISS